MEGTFEVKLAGAVVGEAILRRQGLYTSVFCRCRAPEGKIWRLFAGTERLGVLVPQGQELVLETKVAAKRLKEGCGLTIRDSPEAGWFIPIRPGEEFSAPDRIRGGVLAYRDGVPGLLVDS